MSFPHEIHTHELALATIFHPPILLPKALLLCKDHTKTKKRDFLCHLSTPTLKMTSPYHHVNTFPSAGGTCTLTSTMVTDDDTDMIDEDMDIVMPTQDSHPVETFSPHAFHPSQPQSAYYPAAAPPSSADVQNAQAVYGYGEVKPSTVAHDGYGCDSLDRHSWHSKNYSSSISSRRRSNGGGRSRPQRRGSVTKFSVQAAQQAVIETSFVDYGALNAISPTATAAYTCPVHDDQHRQHQQEMYQHQNQHHHHHQYHDTSKMNFPRRVSEYSDDLDVQSPSTMATLASSSSSSSSSPNILCLY